MSHSTLRHHVRVLEREDLLVTARVRGRRQLYPTHMGAIELAAALNDESTAPIVDTLARLGSATTHELADVIERDESTVSYHLQRLEADGVVVREIEGRTTLNKLSPEAREMFSSLDADTEPTEGGTNAVANLD